jgi:hypothetical protein
MRYYMTWNDIPSGAVADTFRTIASIIVANTTGHRFRVRSLSIGPSDDAPADLNASVKLARTNNATAGTPSSTVTAANMPKVDPGSIDSLMTGGRNYSGGEPTTYETEPLFTEDFNIRGGFIKEWTDPDQMPKVTQNKTLGLLLAPRTAVAIRTSGTIEFEMY